MAVSQVPRYLSSFSLASHFFQDAVSLTAKHFPHNFICFFITWLSSEEVGGGLGGFFSVVWFLLEKT